MKLEAREKTLTVKVAWSEVKLDVQGRTLVLLEATGWTYERGRPLAEPVALDMSRETWK